MIKSNVFVMERYDFSVMVINGILRDLDFNPITFRDPETLMSQLDKKVPFILFYDYDIEKDEEVLEEIHSKFPETKIILINHVGQEINLNEIKEKYGVFSIIQRPFSKKEIKKVLKSL